MSHVDALVAALGKGDIGLLVATCAHMNVHEVFGHKSSQPPVPVLLSLIQQLTSNMSADLSLKTTWVREAAMSLDRTHDLFETHARDVLADALGALDFAYGGCKDQALASELRTCMHVVRAQLA